MKMFPATTLAGGAATADGSAPATATSTRNGRPRAAAEGAESQG